MLLSLMPMSAMAVGATSGTYTAPNGITYALEDGTLTISGEGKCSDVWKDYFGYDAVVTSVVIKDGVTGIEEDTFYGWTSIESVSIPKSVTKIGEQAFTGCSQLTKINVSSENEYYSSIDGVLYNKDQDLLVAFPGGAKKAAFLSPTA